MNKSRQEKIKVVIGHFAWGIHQRISSRECQYISFIRDPLSRILSEFWYARNAARGYPVFDEKIYHAKMPLETYIKTGFSLSVDNLLVRSFSGIGCEGYGTAFRTSVKTKSKEFKCITEDDYKVAKSNIDKYYKFIGITEFFDESMLLIKLKLGWKNIFYESKNIGSKDNIIPSDITQEIVELNKWDYKLYNYCKERFIMQCKENDIFDKSRYYRKINKYVYPIIKSKDIILSKPKSCFKKYLFRK